MLHEHILDRKSSVPHGRWQRGLSIGLGTCLLPLWPVYGEDAVRLISSISSAAAASVLEAGLADARNRAVSVCIVVLDEAGRFIAGKCMDGVPNSAFDVAYAKARHSANFRRPTKFQEDLLIDQNALQVLAVPGMLPLEGGVPIQSGNEWIGAIGVAGAASEIDSQIAAAAVSSLQREEKTSSERNIE